MLPRARWLPLFPPPSPPRFFAPARRAVARLSHRARVASNIWRVICTKVTNCHAQEGRHFRGQGLDEFAARIAAARAPARLASHAGSSCGQSASAMPSASGDECATLAVTIVKRAKEGARILHRERATTGIQSKDEVAISGNISRNLRTTGPPLGGSRKRARK